MFTEACTKDEDCENATIEIGNDDCASLLHYPQEEPLRISLEFPEENEATDKSFEDETQLGNGKDNIESPNICEESSVVNFPAYKQLALQHSFFQCLSRRDGGNGKDNIDLFFCWTCITYHASLLTEEWWIS